MLLIAGAAVVGCSNTDGSAKPPLRTTGAQAEAATQVPGLRVSKSSSADTVTVAGEITDATDRTMFTAHTVGSRVVRIDEQSPPGSDAAATRDWRFDVNEQLMALSEEKSQLAANGNASPTLMRVTTNLEFRGAANIRVSRLVDGVERPVQSWDIENVRRHSDLLLARVHQGLPRH